MSLRIAIRSLSLACAAGVGLAAGSAGAFTSATAAASANEYSLLCSTCSIDFTDLGRVSDGGPGASEAHADNSGEGYSGIADVTFSGPDALPELGVYAFADELNDGLRTYFYEAGATAVGVQSYAYTGAAPTSYSIAYTIDGDFFLTVADAASLMQVYGGVTVYGPGFVPGAEVNPTLGYDYSGENASAVGTAPFHLAGDVTFTVNPGDVITVSSTLFASADSSHQVIGSVDALHTLELSFTAGDSSLLTPEQSATVPEPASALLVGAGVAALGSLSTRRRAGAGSGSTQSAASGSGAPS